MKKIKLHFSGVSLLFNIDLCKSTFSTYFSKKIFSAFCVLFFFCLFCFDFDVTFGDFLGLSPSKKNCVIFLIENPLKMMKNASHPVDKGRKLNVHKTFTRRPGRLLKVLCTFNV